jgi:hypothetical protein
MLWCDKLASTPAVGFQIDPYFAGADNIMEALSPMIASWGGTQQQPNFAMSSPSMGRLEISRNEGNNYTIDPTTVAVTFQHKMRHRWASGGLPYSELISKPAIYSDLVKNVMDELIEVALLLPDRKQRSVQRFGLVSTTVVLIEDVPPGVLKFIDHFTRPWKGNVTGFKVNELIGILKEDDDVLERCIHTITKNETEDQLLTLHFDWQRYFKKSVPIEEESLLKACKNAKTSAFEYLESLAVGDIFDASN